MEYPYLPEKATKIFLPFPTTECMRPDFAHIIYCNQLEAEADLRIQ